MKGIMKNIIDKKYRKMIWKDEIGDDFLLTKRAEIYDYSETMVKVIVFSWSKVLLDSIQFSRFNEWHTDDHLIVFEAKKDNLDEIIGIMGSFKKRPYINGNWIKDKEEMLGHKILQYNPVSLNTNKGECHGITM